VAIAFGKRRWPIGITNDIRNPPGAALLDSSPEVFAALSITTSQPSDFTYSTLCVEPTTPMVRQPAILRVGISSGPHAGGEWMRIVIPGAVARMIEGVIGGEKDGRKAAGFQQAENVRSGKTWLPERSLAWRTPEADQSKDFLARAGRRTPSPTA